MKASVIIPAHNEQHYIGRCLSALTAAIDQDGVEVIVVCNACSDDTAAIARSFGQQVRVIETDVASKSYALNLGDATASWFPRLYVDADVVLDSRSVREVVLVLEDGKALVAAPRLTVDLANCSWAVRAYHEIWLRLPYVANHHVGSGVYALSREGHERLRSFPDTFSEDDYLRLLFEPHERVTVRSATFSITPPRSAAALVANKARQRIGDYEVRRLLPEPSWREWAEQRRALLRLCLRPSLWPSLLVYFLLRLRITYAYWWRYGRTGRRDWDRGRPDRPE